MTRHERQSQSRIRIIPSVLVPHSRKLSPILLPSTHLQRGHHREEHGREVRPVLAHEDLSAGGLGGAQVGGVGAGGGQVAVEGAGVGATTGDLGGVRCGVGVGVGVRVGRVEWDGIGWDG